MGSLLRKRAALAALAAASLWLVLLVLLTEAAHFLALGNF
jgi:hypothetical protein